MQVQNAVPTTQDFSLCVMKTFGKLDADEIKSINGRPDLLVSCLSESYGWSRADAQAKVDRFMADISLDAARSA